MTPVPYRLRTFQGNMIVFVVDEDKHSVTWLANKVSYIHAKVQDAESFHQDYQPVRLTEESYRLAFVKMANYGVSVGLTAEGAVYLTKLVKMTPSDLAAALKLGMATRARIMKEAQRMEAEDKKAGKQGAPRKLAGAELAAVKRKEERLAAEAQQLAGAVSDDQNTKEIEGTADATLDKSATPKSTKPKKTAPKAEPKKAADKPKPEPKVTKAKAEKQPKKAADKPKGFDVASLKKDGEYKSASAMFKGLVLEGKLTDAKIFETVKKKFDLSDDKAGYVQWNRAWLRKNTNLSVPDAK